MFGRIIPVLRIFDEQKAKEFYLGFLGFTLDFEHRFGPNFPLYLGVTRGDCSLHLSEHHGDATPGTRLRIFTDNIAAVAEELQRADYRYAKPGNPEQAPWGEKTLTVTDPFSNRLTFVEVETEAKASATTATSQL